MFAGMFSLVNRLCEKRGFGNIKFALCHCYNILTCMTYYASLVSSPSHPSFYLAAIKAEVGRTGNEASIICHARKNVRAEQIAMFPDHSLWSWHETKGYSTRDSNRRMSRVIVTTSDA